MRLAEFLDAIYGFMLVFNCPFLFWIAALMVIATVGCCAKVLVDRFKGPPELPDGWKSP